MNLPKIPRPKRKRELTAKALVFNLLFIASFPVIIVFYVAFNSLIWLFSLPSKILSFFLNKE
jgi:hypothetical protein